MLQSDRNISTYRGDDMLHTIYALKGHKRPMSNQDDISTALVGIRSRLDMLASINAANILIPGGPQSHYHAIIEEAYTALGLVETQIDELRAELEWQHKRLDEMRDAMLANEQPTAPSARLTRDPGDTDLSDDVIEFDLPAEEK